VTPQNSTESPQPSLEANPKFDSQQTLVTNAMSEFLRSPPDVFLYSLLCL
jgi:hypothetical protein